MQPAVSIIVPVYNAEKYLPLCLDSILSQTYTNFEAVIVDDGSTDRSGAICNDYAQKDSRFVVVHKQNEGVAEARITAFEHSKGELVTFIDADDYVAPDYLEKLAKPIMEQNADMVSCDYYSVVDGKVHRPFPKRTGSFCENQINQFVSNSYFYDPTIKEYGMTCYLWTKMIRRYFVLEGLREGKGMWYAEDQIAVFNILQRCKKLVLIPDRLYYYVQHEEQTMKIYQYSLWENLIVLMEKYEKMDKQNIAIEGRRIRTWLHIRHTIKKMAKVKLTRTLFINHISMMRDSNYMNTFFQPLFIKCDLKNNIGYWILKLRLYSFFYYLIGTKYVRLKYFYS